MTITFFGSLQTINQLLTAGIAITAFSLLLYAMSFNLQDRVARSFAIIMSCVVVVFVSEAIASVTGLAELTEIWYKVQWVGLVFLPSAYLQFSDALLATTGRPSRGRRRLMVRVAYVISFAFLLTLNSSMLVGSLVSENDRLLHLEKTNLSWIFTVFYVSVMIWSWINLWRAYQRTVTSTSRRRMRYLIAGSLAPALGSYPYLLVGSEFASASPTVFWLAATVSNILVSGLIVLMAYAVAFFGVPWPDRVVKRRLFKWVMRGPVTASMVLSVTTVVRRIGASFGDTYSAAVPIAMVSTLLIMQYFITLLSPVWERLLFYGGDRRNLQLVQALEERLLTTSDLRQFLESVLTALCDRFQSSSAFVVSLGIKGFELFVTVGDKKIANQENLSSELIRIVSGNPDDGSEQIKEDRLFSWGDYLLIPLFADQAQPVLLGLIGIVRDPGIELEAEQRSALEILAKRAGLALEDRYKQEMVFNSLALLNPQMDMIQRLRAASQHDGTEILTSEDFAEEKGGINKLVKDALSHYWGGPKLTQSPLLRLRVVQRALELNKGSPVNALRAILKEAVERVRPDGERRFTGEWILYNILDMKFLEGRKVREIALRLAMSEADLYRKQRVAVDVVAASILEMEKNVREEVKSVNPLSKKDDNDWVGVA